MALFAKRTTRFACCHPLEHRRLLSFTAPATYPVGASPQDVIAADFNNDSVADLTTANWSDDTVSVLLGRGDGTFAPALTAATDEKPHVLAAGDFNRDGAIDLATANAYDVSILLAKRDAAGHGTGTFEPPVTVTFAADFNYPQSMDAGDFNGDGLLDIVSVVVFDDASLGPSSAAAVLLGDGKGNFAAPQFVGPNVTSYSFTGVAAKLNGDAYDDFVAVSSIGTVVVRLGSSTGLRYHTTFSVPSDYAYSIAAGRLDGDAHMDLLIGDLSGNVTVLRGNGVGGFSSVGVFATGAQVTEIALGDVNGDGKLDVATPAKLLEGRGDGTLAPAVDLPAGDAYAVAAGDFNSNGRLDLAVTDENAALVRVLLNDAAPTKTFVGPGGSGSGGNWSNGNNWSPSDVPAAGDVVLISGAKTVNVSSNITVSGLSLTGGAKLNLNDKQLTLNYSGASPIGSWNGSAYTGVTGLIQSGRNGGAWNGSGIITSAASGNLTTLGVAEIGGDVVVKFTYGGDANLDGKVNVDDYGRIDFNVALGTSGWFNGDFNYDGKINVDDYGIIDFNIGIQGPPLGNSASAASVPMSPAASVHWVALPSPWAKQGLAETKTELPLL